VAADEDSNLADLPLPAAAVAAPPAASASGTPAAPAAAQPVPAPSAAPRAGTVQGDAAVADFPAFSFQAMTTRIATNLSHEVRATARVAAAAAETFVTQLDLSISTEAQADIAAVAEAGSNSSALDLANALRERSLLLALEPLRRESEAAHGVGQEIVVGSSAVSAGLSVGYVLWLARGGVLMASVMSALPAWASLDPLPVLGQVKGKAAGQAGLGGAVADEDDDTDQDAVEQLFSKAPAAAPAAAVRTGGPSLPPAPPPMQGGLP
jgi:hypothetical protein